MSNAPETVHSQGVLAQSQQVDTTGKFRVFWSHHNATGSPAYAGFAVTNTSQKTEYLYLGKHGHQVGARGPVNAKRLGRELLSQWLESGDQESSYAMLKPGQTAHIGFAVPDVDRGMGMYDVSIRDRQGHPIPGGVQVETYLSHSPDPQNLLQPPPLPSHSKGPRVGRGVFPAANRTLTWNALHDEQITFCSSVHDHWPVPEHDRPVVAASNKTAAGASNRSKMARCLDPDQASEP